ncbi:nephrin-like isoform X2 [Haliotis rubra]|uniref:nephrin-like isoform X2 n=1 Tax=Haliotis rubra TaxID=36100 RepID=UPI001EE629F4|nr:nephrin-like isoform X2 [Haliotis rubra]
MTKCAANTLNPANHRYVGIEGAVTVSGSGGTGIPNQQALTLRCSYTVTPGDVVVAFSWRKREGSSTVNIASGSVTGQTVVFLDTWQNKGVFVGDYTSSLDIQLPASHVNSSHAGTYMCEVDGVSGSSYADVNATILYAPSISGLPSTYQVIELSRLMINCSTYTTPGNPSISTYRWTYGGSTVSTGSVLDRSNISRRQGGNYICTASNTQGSDSASVHVDVLYAPSISGLQGVYKVNESSRLRINCSTYTTPGNPPITTYRWTHGGSTVSTGAVLDRSNISRSQGGIYICTASNFLSPGGGSEQQGTAQVSVDVQYLDTPVLVFEKSEATENDSLTLNCNVMSHPAAELTVLNIDNDTTLAEGNTNTISYTIQRVQCLHNGTFVCSAYNRHTRTTTRASYDLDVLCAPRLDTRVPFISRLYRGLNEVASLKAAIVCNPPPVFKWLAYLDNQLVPIPNSTSHTVITSGQQSVLQVMVRQVSEYGKYSVEATNDVGRTQLVYTIAPAGAPLAPDETVIHNITSTSVWLQWQANFDGGSPQTFSVEYRASGSDWRVWKQGIPDPGQGKWLISHINSLKPNTEYMFQISARNIRGTSSNVVRDATTAGQETCSCITQVSDRLGIGVGVGLGVALPMIISLAITSVVFYRQRSVKPRGSDAVSGKRQTSINADQDIHHTYSDIGDSRRSEYEDLQASTRFREGPKEYEHLRTTDPVRSDAYQNIPTPHGSTDGPSPLYENQADTSSTSF